MKQRFENFLTNRSESDQTSPQVTEDIASIEKNIPDASVRGEILDTQLKKEELVSHLKDWRGKFFGESVDNNIESELGNRTLQHDADGYHTYLKGGVRIPLTEGQIASAKEWGVFWSFDDSVDKNMQQKTMSGQVRELIAGKYDEQLTSFGEQNRLSDDIKRDTYSRIAERSPELDKMQDGILAEKMMMSLLTKAQLDYNLPFSLKRVDVYDDVENKIDFVISVETHNRGVKVDEQGSDVGIQFTMNNSVSKQEQKNKQIERAKKFGDADVDDIILVTMPFAKIRDTFNKWRYDENNNRISEKRLDPRGPDFLMSEDEQVEIFKTLFKSLPIGLTEDQLRLNIQESKTHQTQERPFKQAA